MAPTPVAPIERIKRLSRREDRGYLTPCRIFTGKVHPNGYAKINTGGRGAPKRRVHVIVYEHVFGPVIHELHHRCEQKDCHEPLHLIDLTREQHAREHHATRCIHGHPLSGGNLMTYTRDNRIVRACRACNRDRCRRYYRARKDRT